MADSVQLYEQPISVAQFVLTWNVVPGTIPDFGQFDFQVDATTANMHTYQGFRPRSDGRLFTLPFAYALRGTLLGMVNNTIPIVLCFSSTNDPRINKNDFMVWYWPNGNYRVIAGSWNFDPNGLFTPPVPQSFELQRDMLFFRAYAYSQAGQAGVGGIIPFWYEADSSNTGAPGQAAALLTLIGR